MYVCDMGVCGMWRIEVGEEISDNKWWSFWKGGKIGKDEEVHDKIVIQKHKVFRWLNTRKLERQGWSCMLSL